LQFILFGCVTDANGENSVCLATTGKREDNGGNTNELANHSTLSVLGCASPEYVEETGV
jgi:hypothetical protein